mmetsp:Transcript_41869/g.75440  ORF Transcript_41869/g.75440 Transcript_41869/m.75440 type:complete len:85 (-) Transcript_41869:99-353(-)
MTAEIKAEASPGEIILDINTVTIMATIIMAKEVKVERDFQAVETRVVASAPENHAASRRMNGPLRCSNQVLYVTFEAPHHTVPF